MPRNLDCEAAAGWKTDWAGSHRNSGVHSWTAEELVLPSPKLKNCSQIQDWSSRGTSCFSQVQIWPPLFINPVVNAALDLPVIFTVVIIPLSAVPWFPWVSRGWWVFQLPLESAQMPLSPWWRHRESGTFQYHCGHLNEAEWAYPEPPNFITILAEETVQFLVDSHQLCH